MMTRAQLRGRQPHDASHKYGESKFGPRAFTTSEPDKKKPTQDVPRSQDQSGFNFGELSLFSREVVQTKLVLGSAVDKHEREADWAARLAVESISSNDPISVQRQNGEMLRRKIASIKLSPVTEGESVGLDIESIIQRERGNGEPLSDDERLPMEQAFGAGFGDVRLHTDIHADRLSRLIQARAFTTGQDIFFRQGEYSRGHPSGQEILAHELTHVVQQNGRVLNIQRRLSADYNTIKDNLSYGVFDWAITDEEARQVLHILDNLSEDDLRDTVQQMKRDGILSRLLGNVSASDRSSFADLLSRIRSIQEELASLPDCCKRALRTIDRMISSGRALRGLLGAAPFITLIGENPVHVAVQLLHANWDIYRQAIISVDPIIRNRVYTVITLHLLDHLNTREEAFWNKMEELWRG